MFKIKNKGPGAVTHQMNLQNFYTLNQKYNENVKNNSEKKTFKEMFCQNKFLNELEIADDKGQIRQGGICPKHIQRIKDDIFRQGQLVPITIEEKMNSNGKYDVVDGNHRVIALKELQDEAEEGSTHKHIQAMVYSTAFASEEERVQYQLKENEHPPAKNSTREDYALALHNKLSTAAGIEGITLANFNEGNDDGKVAILEEYMKKGYNIHPQTAKSIVTNELKKAPNSKLYNFTKVGVIKLFSGNNSFGWAGKNSGDECNGKTVYAVGVESHIFPNACGNAFKKKTDNSNGEVILLCWCSNTVGKNSASLKKYREILINRINSANQSWLLKSGNILFDTVVFAPQKKKEKGCIIIKKDSNGRFITKGL